jgi:formylglycine-generating enzyme required for sulfatase activity
LISLLTFYTYYYNINFQEKITVENKQLRGVIIMRFRLLIVFIIFMTFITCIMIKGNNRSYASSKGSNYTESVDGVNFDMVYISSGTFKMGQAGIAEPVHSVTLSDFYIGKCEVTNREYALYDPGHKGQWADEKNPVETVSWDKSVDYCTWLSEKTGKTYRLPTEAEWEYACRAGTTTTYYWGNSMDDNYCWYDKNSGDKVHPAGQKKSNSWGLYDMSGNVWEWCNDFGDTRDYLSSNPVTDPSGPKTGGRRIFRGGCWCYNALDCRSANRNSGGPDQSYYYCGFRICRSGK